MKKLLAFAGGVLLLAVATIMPIAPAYAQRVTAIEAQAPNVNAEQAALGAPSLYPHERASLTQYAPDGQVAVPWGDWLSELIGAAIALIAAAALALFRRLPAHLVSALDAFAGMMGQGRADALLEKAVNYGVNVTQGAVRGKTMNVKIGNEVLERAFEYAVRHAPTLVKKLGGLQQVREKIIARLDLDENAAVPAPRPPVETLIVEAATPAGT